MLTRRDLLFAVLGTGAASPRVFRVRVSLPAGGAAARGATLGLEEARQTASLLGQRIEAASGGSLAFAAVGWDAPPQGPERPFFTVRGTSPLRSRVFHVASSPDFRKKALMGKAKGLRAVDWHPSLFRFGAEQLNERFHRRFKLAMDEEAWRGWMAVKIAAELALRGGDPGSLIVDGHKGAPLSFADKDHHLVQPVYLVDGKGKVVEEVAP